MKIITRAGGLVLGLASAMLVPTLASAATLLPGPTNPVLYNFDFTSGAAVGLSGPCGPNPCPVFGPPYTHFSLELFLNGVQIGAPVGMAAYNGLNGTDYVGTVPTNFPTLPSQFGSDGIFSIGFFALATPVVYDTIVAVGFVGSVPGAFLNGVPAIPEPSAGWLATCGLATLAALFARRRSSRGGRSPVVDARLA